MKKHIKGILMAFLAIASTGTALLGAACSKKNAGDGDNAIAFTKVGNGKVLSLYGKYQSTDGALGITVGYDDIDYVSETFYANYSKVEKKDGGYLAEAKVTTENGSVVSATDFIKETNGKVGISRTIKVEQAAEEDLGFTSFFPMEAKRVQKVEDYEWFSPSNYYGNDLFTFSSIGVKTSFNGDQSMITADNMGAPLMMMYDGEVGLSILDKTPGLRETVAADMGIDLSWILIDERLNMPGIGIANVEREDGVHAKIFHAYPAYSYNYLGMNPYTTQYRMLPMEVNLEREIAFEWTLDNYDSFTEGAEKTWREAYDEYAVVDKRYAATDVRDVLLRATDERYTTAGGPQFFAISGEFLHRNAGLAWLVLAEGRRTMNETYIAHGLDVLNDQVARNILDGNNNSDTYIRNRNRSDGLTALARAYQNELSFGIDHTDWLNYLIECADKREGQEYWINAQFLTEVARITKNKKYIDWSIELMEKEAENHLNFKYTGAIGNPAGDPFIDREAAIISLTIYVNLYELTGMPKWLDMAKHTALLVESYHQIQPILMEPYDTTGFEKDVLWGYDTKQGFIGNGKIMPYGLSYISSQCTSTDISGVLCAPDFLRLYEFTKDEHYFDFYEYITYNSTLYVNMGDKIWLMDGNYIGTEKIGHINEYIGLSAGGDKMVLRRGSMHEATLGWCVYAILQNYERTYTLLQEDGAVDSHIVAADDVNRSFNLAKHKYAEVTADGIIVDLREVCSVYDIVNFDGKVSYSLDKATWTEKSGDAIKARFVKLHTQTLPENLEIQGIPVLYKNLARNATATVSDGAKPLYAIDGNYRTGCQINAGATLTIDFGSARDVYAIAATFFSEGDHEFTVEVSVNGESWTEYMSFSGTSCTYVGESVVTGVQYVRIIYHSGASMHLGELKILGN